jgi:hypothetical protein
LEQKGEDYMKNEMKNETNWTDEQVNERKDKEKGQMDEKVLYEIRYVETEDGFRIEAKGNKKGLRRMGYGPKAILSRGGGRGRKRRHMKRRLHARRAALAAEGPRGPRDRHGCRGRGPQQDATGEQPQS